MDNEFILAVFNLNTEKALRGTKIPGLKFTTSLFDEGFYSLVSASQ